MKLNSLVFSVSLLLFKSTWSLSPVHSQAKLVVVGNTLKLKCPVNSTNINLIKWYKDGEEFCRFYPGKQPLHTSKENVQNVSRNKHSVKPKPVCDRTGLNLGTVNITSEGTYTCYIVVEDASMHRIVKRNASVLVYPTTGPFIKGIKSIYKDGEVIQANCTASPSNPPPTLLWYINGVAAYGWSMISYPCQMTEDGLCALRLGLKISATKKIFPKGIASFVCEASILALPSRRAYVTSTLVGEKSSGNIHLLPGALLTAIIFLLCNSY